MSSAVTSAPGGEPATTSEDSARQLRLRVLNDIADGKVFQRPDGNFHVTSDTVLGDHEQPAYIAELRLLLAAMWVMQWRGQHAGNRGSGGVRLRLTTLGEVRRDELMAGVPA